LKAGLASQVNYKDKQRSLEVKDGQTCSMHEPHIVKPKLQRAATYKFNNTNLFAIYASVTSYFFLERLGKVILYCTLATTAPTNNISTRCNRNKK